MSAPATNPPVALKKGIVKQVNLIIRTKRFPLIQFKMCTSNQFFEDISKQNKILGTVNGNENKGR